jgi:hypothetical protein
MEENREPQHPAAAPVIYPPTYSSPQPAYYAPAQPVKASPWLRFRRMLRLILIRLLRGMGLVGRALRPYAVFVVAIVALLGVIGWMAYMLWAPQASAASFARAESLPPATAVENYIKGQQNYNAELMWDAYSTDYQAAQLANGATKANLQAQANSQRTMGLKYVHYDYIGGVKDDEGSMYFYSVDLAMQNQHARLHMIFRADADGKIVGIDSPLTRMSNSDQ